MGSYLRHVLWGVGSALILTIAACAQQAGTAQSTAPVAVAAEPVAEEEAPEPATDTAPQVITTRGAAPAEPETEEPAMVSDAADGDGTQADGEATEVEAPVVVATVDEVEIAPGAGPAAAVSRQIEQPARPAPVSCVASAEDVAISVRMLQTRLMVAALSCRTSLNPEFTSQYNSFVRKFGAQLGIHAKNMRRDFSNRYGGRANRQIDRFVTAIANDISRRSMDGAGFCENTAPMFDRMLAAQPQQIGDLAVELVGPQTCSMLVLR